MTDTIGTGLGWGVDLVCRRGWQKQHNNSSFTPQCTTKCATIISGTMQCRPAAGMVYSLPITERGAQNPDASMTVCDECNSKRTLESTNVERGLDNDSEPVRNHCRQETHKIVKRTGVTNTRARQSQKNRKISQRTTIKIEQINVMKVKSTKRNESDRAQQPSRATGRKGNEEEKWQWITTRDRRRVVV